MGRSWKDIWDGLEEGFFADLGLTEEEQRVVRTYFGNLLGVAIPRATREWIAEQLGENYFLTDLLLTMAEGQPVHAFAALRDLGKARNTLSSLYVWDSTLEGTRTAAGREILSQAAANDQALATMIGQTEIVIRKLFTRAAERWAPRIATAREIIKTS